MYKLLIILLLLKVGTFAQSITEIDSLYTTIIEDTSKSRAINFQIENYATDQSECRYYKINDTVNYYFAWHISESFNSKEEIVTLSNKIVFCKSIETRYARPYYQQSEPDDIDSTFNELLYPDLNKGYKWIEEGEKTILAAQKIEEKELYYKNLLSDLEKGKQEAIIEQKVFQLLMTAVPEIEIYKKNLFSDSNKRFVIFVEEYPRAIGIDNFQIYVGEGSDFNYIRKFTFRINLKTRKIYFYDIVKEKILDLAEWRNQQK